MKKALAWVLVLAMTAAIAVGGTLAYLTDTDEDVNVMTLGKVKIDQLEYERIDVETKNEGATVQEFHDNKPLYPAITDKGSNWSTGDANVGWAQIGKEGYTSGIWDPDKINNELDKMVFVKNKGSYDAYVRSVFAFEANGYTLEQFKELFHLNINQTDWTWEWEGTTVAIPDADGSATTNYIIATATYNKVLKPGELTEISLSQIALDPKAGNADVEGFGDTYQVLVKTQGIQADGFDDPDVALNEGFGEITADDIPWENDSPIKGIDLRTALHNYEGDANSQITTKVTNVVFARNSQYPEIIADHEGTLVDVEQDVPVYAYYVPSGSGNYDVYFLADDVIYSPKDSSSLYQGMSALKTVDTGNYDVSRVEYMQKMFRDCAKLTTLDTTDWDTSRVTDMSQTFYKCGALKEIPGIGSWDTGAVTSMKGMFRQSGLEDLELAAWDVDNVTNMAQMFYKCPNLVNVDAENWDTGACTDMGYMFTANSKLQTAKVNGWDTSSVNNMYGMFNDCGKLITLDVTSWDTSNVTNATFMFTRCRSLESLVGSGNWDLGKVTDMSSMFEGTDSLAYLDATKWNCGSCENMAQMFGWSLSLKEVKGTENWDVSNVKSMRGMFAYCYELKEMNVSNWDVSNVESFALLFASEHPNAGDMKLEKVIGLDTWDPKSVTSLGSMFYGCGQLTEVDLSGWNMPKVTTFNHMFADCYKLETIDVSGWQTPALVTMDAMFNNCEALKSIDMSSFDTSNVKEFSQLFEACKSLESIQGMKNWDTSKACTFAEMFSGCSSLKELDLSSFDTSAAYDNYIDMNNSTSHAFEYMFSGVNSLEKLVLSDKISFLGNGDVSESRKLTLPKPASIEGADGKWYDMETGVGYLPSEIPEKTAATYVAVMPTEP